MEDVKLVEREIRNTRDLLDIAIINWKRFEDES